MGALKTICVLAIVLAICYQTNVNYLDDNYTLKVSKKFNVALLQLYRFVTNPELVDRWMQWLPFFMAADFKPLGVGKHFYVFSNDFQYIINVTDHKPGKFLALESDVFLRPRIELIFSEPKSNDGETSKLKIRMNFQRTSMLFQNTIGRLYRKVLEEKLKASLDLLNVILNQTKEMECDLIFHEMKSKKKNKFKTCQLMKFKDKV